MATCKHIVAALCLLLPKPPVKGTLLTLCIYTAILSLQTSCLVHVPFVSCSTPTGGIS